MSKQLRIWLFVLLGTLLASSSLLAEGVITMTTSKAVGETILLKVNANGDFSINGAQETSKGADWFGRKSYTITSQTITIRGDVTTLYCPLNQLTSLNLSGCTDLTTLDCYDNSLTSLDLSGCTALTELECYSNQLTSLDVSGCTALTGLYCHSNQLTSLDVSGCTALTGLGCSNNPLTSVNLSGCQSLKVFSWTGGKLTSLNVSGCTALTTLICDHNQLTSLDVSGCTALRWLKCWDNKLTSLDVSSCSVLTTLDCYENQLPSLDVSGCTALTKLDCERNQLPSLDVSGCTALTTLYCSNNQLTSLDVSGCTALTTLYCYENQLTSLDVSKTPVLIWLDCRGNQIKGKEMTRLVNSLPDCIGKKAGRFTVVQEPAFEGNICLKSDVAIAKGKNWNTLKYKSDTDEDVAYEGAEDAHPLKVTLTKEGEGTLTATGAADLDAVDYGTELTIVATPAAGYKLTALTANGTDILATKKIVVKEAVEVKATFVDHTGVETTVTQQVKLYPNPATDYVIVEGVAPASEVTLHSMTGERLYAGRADDRGTLQIDLTPYADGVYLVCVAGETYRVVVRR